MRNYFHQPSAPRGFTLIELLVVVGIMAAMLSVAAIGIQNVDKGQATVSGLAQAQSLMDEARNLAISHGTRARLCIHAEPNEEDRNLRFMVVAFERIERDGSGQETGRSWRVNSRGTSLPSKVYFHPSFSQAASARISGLGSHGTNGSEVRFPGGNNSTRQPNYFYYEFNSEGVASEQGVDESGAAFVLCRGSLTTGDSEPRVIGNDVDGFVVWRNGRTSPIRDTQFLTR